MAPTKLQLRLHTDAVLDKLRTTGFQVGDGTRSTGEDGKGELLPPPCMVLYSVPGGRRHGTVDDWTRHAELVYQVTCIGATRGECEQLVEASEVLLEGFTVAGRVIGPVWPNMVPSDDDLEQVRKDDTVGDPVFVATPRYRFRSSPAG